MTAQIVPFKGEKRPLRPTYGDQATVYDLDEARFCAPLVRALVAARYEYEIAEANHRLGMIPDAGLAAAQSRLLATCADAALALEKSEAA
jgi:hypothetical protein